MTHYVSIAPVQEPFDVGVGDDGRIAYAFNVVATKRPSATFLKDLMLILVAAGVGVENVSIFAGSKAVLPDAPATVLHIKATGGVAPLGTHNDGAGAYRRPGAQVVVRASSQPAAETMALAAYNALIAVRNREVA